jgi:hypothetical protein
MQEFETQIRPAITGTDGRVEAYTVEFRRDGRTHVAVTLYEAFGSQGQSSPEELVARAKATIRQLLDATGETQSDTEHEPGQPEGPRFSSSQTEPELDDAPTVHVTGEGMIRPE